MMWLIRGIRDLPFEMKARLGIAWFCFLVGLSGALLMGWHTQHLYVQSVCWLVGWSVLGIMLSEAGGES